MKKWPGLSKWLKEDRKNKAGNRMCFFFASRNPKRITFVRPVGHWMELGHEKDIGVGGGGESEIR
jgi:hypothetical protein